MTRDNSLWKVDNQPTYRPLKEAANLKKNTEAREIELFDQDTIDKWGPDSWTRIPSQTGTKIHRW